MQFLQIFTEIIWFPIFSFRKQVVKQDRRTFSDLFETHFGYPAVEVRRYWYNFLAQFLLQGRWKQIKQKSR